MTCRRGGRRRSATDLDGAPRVLFSAGGEACRSLARRGTGRRAGRSARWSAGWRRRAGSRRAGGDRGSPGTTGCKYDRGREYGCDAASRQQRVILLQDRPAVRLRAAPRTSSTKRRGRLSIRRPQVASFPMPTATRSMTDGRWPMSMLDSARIRSMTGRRAKRPTDTRGARSGRCLPGPRGGARAGPGPGRRGHRTGLARDPADRRDRGIGEPRPSVVRRLPLSRPAGLRVRADQPERDATSSASRPTRPWRQPSPRPGGSTWSTSSGDRSCACPTPRRRSPPARACCGSSSASSTGRRPHRPRRRAGGRDGPLHRHRVAADRRALGRRRSGRRARISGSGSPGRPARPRRSRSPTPTCAWRRRIAIATEAPVVLSSRMPPRHAP